MTTKTKVPVTSLVALAASLGLMLPKSNPSPRITSGPLNLRKCDPSRHGCLRYGQVERRRKLRRKGR